jgi:hypothetical protein
MFSTAPEHFKERTLQSIEVREVGACDWVEKVQKVPADEPSLWYILFDSNINSAN